MSPSIGLGAAMIQIPTTVAGPPSAGGTRVPAWRRWSPGLDNDDLTLRQVLATLPAAPPTAIPWIVRLFENPHGWLRLHGAVDLAHHDRIHVLLGRGLLGQDEAFVIGFTMGCTKRLSRLEQAFFKFVAAHVYPEPYRISETTLAAFDLGVEAGREFGVQNLHEAVGDAWLDRPLGEVRRALAIDSERLRAIYARERAALPGTAASARLPGAAQTNVIKTTASSSSSKGSKSPS